MESVTQSIDTPDYTFTLPDLSIYEGDFRKFLEKDLIECSTLNSLESAQRLNWWAETGFCRKLWPLATTGDGNCLLHAASLAMWGFHDRKLTLRAALSGVLQKGDYKDALWRRWRFQQTRLNKQAVFVYSEIEWAKEWEEIVSMASPEPRQSKVASRRRSIAVQDSIDDNATYESLEEVHIFALAHVLRRTIIVVADTVLRDMNGEAMAPIPFGGVYLPFEIPSTECHRAPLLLTYDMAHFSALVAMESDNEHAAPALIPLTDCENVLLTIQFCIDPGDGFDWKKYDGSEGNWALTDREHIALLKEYLDIVYAPLLGTPEEEIFDDLTDEDYDRCIAAGEMTFADENNSNAANGKSKAARQIQSVAKQFGSIGKSMSKKLKKNIGSITKIGSSSGNGKSSKKLPLSSSGQSTQCFTRQRILCAQLKAKRHDYQEEMIKNYLECAHDRFMDTEKAKELRESEQKQLDALKITSDASAVIERGTHCINAGCNNSSTAATSYMCVDCFEKQRQQELKSGLSGGASDMSPRYGTGNSKFYTECDLQTHKSIKRIPSVRRLQELDQTLYLSNSTFYNDKRSNAPEAPLNGSSTRQQGYCPTDTASNTRIIPITLETDPVEPQYHNYAAAVASIPSRVTSCPPSAGAVSLFSPGNTVIHNARQTVNLPPVSPHSPPYQTTIQHNILGIAHGDDTDPKFPSRKTYSASISSEPLPSYASVIRIEDSTPATNSSRIATPFQDAQPCRTRDCKFFGSANTSYYCSKCCLLNTQPMATAKTQSKILTDV